MKNLNDARLYAVSCAPREGMSYAQLALEALSGGADVFQLRIKGETDNFFFQQAVEVQRVCQKLGGIFIVNDRFDIALAAGADGVHLGQDDLPIKSVRKSAGAGFLIGRSTHSIQQALEAEKEGADYIGVGPVFATPTKPGYKEVGLELVREVSRQVKIPFVAIGGIDESNIADVLKAGARMCAFVRAVCGRDDARQAAKNLKGKIIKEICKI